MMFEAEVFSYEFGSDQAQEIGLALQRNHAVEIGGRLFWPISASYNKREDIITFRAEPVPFVFT